MLMQAFMQAPVVCINGTIRAGMGITQFKIIAADQAQPLRECSTDCKLCGSQAKTTSEDDGAINAVVDGDIIDTGEGASFEPENQIVSDTCGHQ